MDFKNRELVSRHLFPVGVNLFVIRDGKLLLGRRRDASYHDGEWGVPGGHLEEGELMASCAARELDEEVGLQADAFTLVAIDNDVRQDGFHYVHVGFTADGVRGEPVLKEPHKCYGWDWFSLTQLPEPLFIGHRKLIQGFIAGRLFTE
jgi:8-oxo-dGTP diphosphatase